MSDMNYSLCAAYPLRNKPDKLIFFRLADYDVYSREYTPILRTNWITEIEPKIIGAKPSDIRENLTEVRKWKYDDSDERGHTFSYRYDAAFFDIIFPKELSGINYSDTKRLREVLLTGFSLDEDVGADLLIVIGETASRYAAIYCAKNKLKLGVDGRYCFSDNIADVLHTTHFLPEYDIHKTDVIDTADIGITLTNGATAPTRYFYRFSELPQSNVQFHLFSLETYIPQFVARYLRKNKEVSGIGNADIRKITDTIQVILHNREYISEYFATTGYTQEHLCERLPEYSAVIAEMFSDQELDDAIRTTLFSSEKIKNCCFDAARNEWMQEQDQQRTAILDELAKLTNSRAQLELQKEDILEQVASQRALSKELDESISEKKAEMAKLQSDIDAELRQFSDSVVHNIALTSVAQAVVAQGSDERDSKNSLIKTNSFEAIGADDEIDNRSDFEELLSENLEVLGYSAEDAVDLSQLITFCIYNKLPLVVANDSENIANAVSAMFGMSQTGILNLPSGFADIEKLQRQIEHMLKTYTATAIYVTGVFDGYSVSVFNALRHVIKESLTPVFVIISLDGINPEMLPHTIWESAVYLDDNSILQYAEDAPLSMCKTIPTIETQYSEKEVKAKLKELKPFMDLIDRRACIQLAKLMVDFDVDITDSATILQQLFAFASARNNVEKLNEVLKDYSISDKAKRLIQRYM